MPEQVTFHTDEASGAGQPGRWMLCLVGWMLLALAGLGTAARSGQPRLVNGR